MKEPTSPSPLIDPAERTLSADGGAVTIRLERTVWDAFDDICQREGVGSDELLAGIGRRAGNDSLAAKIDDYVTRYFKDALDRDPPARRGLSEDDGGEPVLGAATLAALDAVAQAGKK